MSDADSFDEYCVAKLASLSIDDEAIAEYINGILLQDDVEESEKIEAIESTLEGFGTFDEVGLR